MRPSRRWRRCPSCPGTSRASVSKSLIDVLPRFRSLKRKLITHHASSRHRSFKRMHYTGLIEKYRDRLPVAPDTPVVSLNEGNTPLIELKNLPRLVHKQV